MDGEKNGEGADDKGGDARHPDFLARFPFFAVMEHVGVKIMGERGAGRDGEASHHRQDGGESDGGDEGKEDLSTQRVGQERSGHIIGGLAIHDNAIRRKNGGGAKTKKRRHDIKKADDQHGPHDRDAGGLGVRHGVKANENMG